MPCCSTARTVTMKWAPACQTWVMPITSGSRKLLWQTQRCGSLPAVGPSASPSSPPGQNQAEGLSQGGGGLCDHRGPHQGCPWVPDSPLGPLALAFYPVCSLCLVSWEPGNLQPPSLAGSPQIQQAPMGPRNRTMSCPWCPSTFPPAPTDPQD